MCESFFHAWRYVCIIDSTLLWFLCICVSLSGLGVYVNNSRQQQKCTAACISGTFSNDDVSVLHSGTVDLPFVYL